MIPGHDHVDERQRERNDENYQAGCGVVRQLIFKVEVNYEQAKVDHEGSKVAQSLRPQVSLSGPHLSDFIVVPE